MRHDRPQPHSVWLCPAPDTAAALQKEIDMFARNNRGESFAPHVTLAGDLTCAPRQTIGACHDLLLGRGAIPARVTGIAQSDSFFMALFLDVTLPKRVASARSALFNHIGASGTSEFRPHLSIAYGLGPEDVSPDALGVLETRHVGEEIELTTAVVVSAAGNVPIAAWQPLHVLSLLG